MPVSFDDQRVWSNINEDLKDALLLNIVSTLECSVCSEVMHVPFLATCGHSFCYACLNAWFETKVNCPTCRTDLDEPPLLNLQLKDTSRAITDLVIDTLEDAEHRRVLLEARKKLIDEFESASRSKNLFGDAFKTAPTLVDKSDGVPRCGNCHWEAHGSVCLNCGSRFRTPRGDSYYDSEDGDAYNEDQDEVELYGVANEDYDSEDSFLDNRDIHQINNDRHPSANDDILSSGEDGNSETESWEGFRRDEEMYRGSENEDLTSYEHALPEDDTDWDSEHSMIRAVDRMHNQDVQDYIELDATELSPTASEAEDANSGPEIAGGRRTIHVIESDSDWE